MKILVIDDNKSITKLISKFFKMKGHECIATNDGKEGLSLCLNDKFDGIILDLAMPEFTGEDFLESLRKQGQIDRQKIIVLTALPLGNIKIEDKRHGICEVVQKPANLGSLMKSFESINAVT